MPKGPPCKSRPGHGTHYRSAVIYKDATERHIAQRDAARPRARDSGWSFTT
ncbi:MAG: hypothetical protein ACKVP1_09290 [Burkholderiaceae bacterium]